MVPINASEIASIRAEVQGAWPDQATVLLRSSPVSDGRGGRTYTFAAQPPVACRLSPVPFEVRREAEGAPEADRVASVRTWQILLPYGTAIGTDDRVQVNGRTYEVLGQNGNRSHAHFVNVSARILD